MEITPMGTTLNECWKKSHRKKSHGKKVTNLGRKKKVTEKSHKKRIMLFLNFWLGINIIFIVTIIITLFCLD